MTFKTVMIHALLVAASLGGSYLLKWHRPDPGESAEAVILELERSELQSVRLSRGESFWALYRSATSRHEVWIQYHSREGGEGHPAGSGGGDRSPGELRGGAHASWLFDSFAPLRASRYFGVLSEEQLEQVGVEGSAFLLRVEDRSGRSHEFELIIELRSNGSYLRRSDGRTYLLAVPLPTPGIMEGFVDVALHREGFTFDELTIRAPTGARRFKRGTGDALIPLEGSTVDAVASSWHGRMWGLEPIKALGRGEEPSGHPLTVRVRVEYFDMKRESGFVELATDEEGQMYARSEYSMGWLELPSEARELFGWIDETVKGPGRARAD